MNQPSQGSAREAVDRQPERSWILMLAMGTGALVIAVLLSVRALQVQTTSVELPADEMATVFRLDDNDEARIRKTCVRCHQFPLPNILPRVAWEETIWGMFEESGYGTTVRWEFTPEAIIEWYEERAPEQFQFDTPETNRAASDTEELVKRMMPASKTTAPPVVSHILMGDIVSDAEPEVIICDMLNGQVLLGHPSQPELQLESIGQIANPAHAERVDLNQDGLIDLVVANLGSFQAMDHNLGSVCKW